jgi:hypothetical protein
VPPNDPHAHTASIAVDASPDDAFAFMASGRLQTHWALGSWDREHVEGDVYRGTSLWDGSDLYVRVTGHPELRLVDYAVGPDPDALRRVVEARVVDRAELGHDDGGSVITLTVWRTRDERPDSWARTFHAFQTEVHLIRGRLDSSSALAVGRRAREASDHGA